jgi:hypothetical protein
MRDLSNWSTKCKNGVLSLLALPCLLPRQGYCV